MIEDYFSFKGRINRKSFWLRALAMYAVFITVTVFVYLGMGGPHSLSVGGYYYSATVILSGGIFLMAVMGFFVSISSLSVRRFHDRNKPGWWLLIALGIIVVFAGVSKKMEGADIIQTVAEVAFLIIWVWLLFELGFRRGIEGPNRYGPDSVPIAVADPELFGTEGRLE